ncbi:MAG: hypothetical protein KBT36_14130 [Kurthia sp.]|nr:hypothetical protein [Candidatus Kurthia equi]
MVMILDQRKEAVDNLLETLIKIAMDAPDQLPMYIAESTAVLAMNGFMPEELADFDEKVQAIIDIYLGGELLDSNVVRDNVNIH